MNLSALINCFVVVLVKAGALGGDPRDNSNNLHWTLRQSIKKCLAVLLDEDAIVQHHDDPGVGLGANQAAHALAEFQNRLGQ